jgi:hypothetical protein
VRTLTFVHRAKDGFGIGTVLFEMRCEILYACKVGTSTVAPVTLSVKSNGSQVSKALLVSLYINSYEMPPEDCIRTWLAGSTLGIEMYRLTPRKHVDTHSGISVRVQVKASACSIMHTAKWWRLSCHSMHHPFSAPAGTVLALHSYIIKTHSDRPT